MPTLNRCHRCSATSYRRMIDRNAAGAMGPTGQYRCTGCGFTFTNLDAWRRGGMDELPQVPVPVVQDRPPLT